MNGVTNQRASCGLPANEAARQQALHSSSRRRKSRPRCNPHRTQSVACAVSKTSHGSGWSASPRPRSQAGATTSNFPIPLLPEPPLFCPDCGTWNRNAARDCTKCGAALPQVRAAAEAPDALHHRVAAGHRQPLPDPAPGGLGRHGGRVRRRARAAGPAARGETRARAPRARRGDAHALPPRGRSVEPARPSADLHADRLRRGRRRGLSS